MVNLTIDGIRISVPEGTTIMDAAASVGVKIPHLCYLRGINEIAACRVCVVEEEGREKLVTSCNNSVEEGMVLYTNSPRVRQARKTNVRLILSQHDCRCAVCVRSGNCALQSLANDMGMSINPYVGETEHNPWNMQFPLIRDNAKCIKCMRCIQVCDKIQTLNVWDVNNTGSRTTVNVANGGNIETANSALPTARLRPFTSATTSPRFMMPFTIRTPSRLFRLHRLCAQPGAKCSASRRMSPPSSALQRSCAESVLTTCSIPTSPLT